MAKKQELITFLESQHIPFETLIQCFNFWNGLSVSERVNFIRMHEQGRMIMPKQYDSSDNSKCAAGNWISEK